MSESVQVPPLDSGVVLVLVAVWLPVPQDRVHASHGPHSPITQSTEISTVDYGGRQAGNGNTGRMGWSLRPILPPGSISDLISTTTVTTLQFQRRSHSPGQTVPLMSQSCISVPAPSHAAPSFSAAVASDLVRVCSPATPHVLLQSPH